MLCIYIIFVRVINQFFGIMRGGGEGWEVRAMVVTGYGLGRGETDYNIVTTNAVTKEAIICIF
jgi:hypothetical protein